MYCICTWLCKPGGQASSMRLVKGYEIIKKAMLLCQHCYSRTSFQQPHCHCLPSVSKSLWEPLCSILITLKNTLLQGKKRIKQPHHIRQNMVQNTPTAWGWWEEKFSVRETIGKKLLNSTPCGKTKHQFPSPHYTHPGKCSKDSYCIQEDKSEVSQLLVQAASPLHHSHYHLCNCRLLSSAHSHKQLRKHVYKYVQWYTAPP